MAFYLDASNALRYPGQEYPFSAEITLEKMIFSGDPVEFTDISATGVMTGADEEVSVAGHVTAYLNSRCVRCLEDVRRPIEADFDVIYARKQTDDPDKYLITGSKLPIDEAVRDALIMEIPIRILCSEDCRGLCPICGANLNKESCSCEPEADDTAPNPFAALKAIVENYEEV